MNTVEISPAPGSVTAIEHDWRFADLVLHALSDPELATRYRRDPRAVLTEFGFDLDEGTACPELPDTDIDADLVVEELDRSASTGLAFFTLCWSDGDAPHGGAPAR